MIKQKIRLTVVIKNIDGGTGTFMFSLMKLPSLYKADSNCNVLALEKPAHTNLDEFSYINYLHQKPQNYGYRNLHKIIFILFKEFIFLKNNIEIYKPQVIIPIDVHCSLIICLLKFLFFPNLKIIITFHNNVSAVFKFKHTFFPPFFIRIMGRYLFKSADFAIGVSKGVTKDIKKVFSLKNNIQTIYYGINLNKTKKLAQEKLGKTDQIQFKTKVIKLISVGRLDPQKDIVSLLYACRELISKKLEFKLFLIGDGKDKSKITNLINKLNLKNIVNIIGWKNNIYPYLKKSDVFIMSSFYEGFPYVLLEAMSMNLPILATDIDYGPRELLENGKYGLLYKPENDNQLVHAMQKLITNKSLRLKFSLKSKQRITSFSEEKMLENYSKLFQKTINS